MYVNNQERKVNDSKCRVADFVQTGELTGHFQQLSHSHSTSTNVIMVSSLLQHHRLFYSRKKHCGNGMWYISCRIILVTLLNCSMLSYPSYTITHETVRQTFLSTKKLHNKRRDIPKPDENHTLSLPHLFIYFLISHLFKDFINIADFKDQKPTVKCSLVSAFTRKRYLQKMKLFVTN